MTQHDSQQRHHFDAFPYQAYDAQQDFMDNLYTALDRGGVSLLESPTGTGKTLSLICGTLKWLEERTAADEAQSARAASTHKDVDLVPDWMMNFSMRSSQAAASAGTRPHRKGSATSPQARKPEELNSDTAEFLPEVWDSDDDKADPKRKRIRDDPTLSESATSPDKELVYKARQVYFISRTHSQLSQFVGELRKTRYKDSMKLAALASRQALCINADVTKLKSAAAINEKCLDLQKPSTKQAKGKGKKNSCKCPYFSATHAARKEVQAAIHQTPMDVEDLGKLGGQRGVCPYYAARAAVPESDIILLPYSGLLSQEARDAIGVRLKGSILIIDEAHNLVDAVNAVHSATISSAQLQSARAKLSTYHTKFQSRLAQGNEQNIQMLIHVSERLAAFLGQQPPSAVSASQHDHSPTTSISTVNDFLFMTGLDNIDFFTLRRYMIESKIMMKVAGYHDFAQATHPGGLDQPEAAAANATEGLPDNCRGTAPLQALASFCTALSNHDADGRIVVDRSTQTLRFILLHAAQHFAKVITQAHAVILASGTLSPTESLKAQLFPSQPVHAFKCGHVVPKENLLAIALQKGPSGQDLDFRHQKRSQPSTSEQLGRLLVNFCRAVPQGIVVFFSSYGFAEETVARWRGSGMMAQLQARKQVFTEPKTASQVEATLKQYRECIEGPDAGQQTGALLLCVVGGKLAEGINFADGMGRCVVMVGMPFPNPTDPELRERMHHMQLQGKTKETIGKDWGCMYYEDLCFKAVNQCIGRVIRHAKDWAAIILADARWASGDPSARNQLPAWIQESMVVSHTFGDAYTRIMKFCNQMGSPA